MREGMAAAGRDYVRLVGFELSLRPLGCYFAFYLLFAVFACLNRGVQSFLCRPSLSAASLFVMTSSPSARCVTDLLLDHPKITNSCDHVECSYLNTVMIFYSGAGRQDIDSGPSLRNVLQDP
jgi:hypothetical protein